MFAIVFYSSASSCYKKKISFNLDSTRYLPEVLRHFYERHLCDFKEVQDSNLQSRILSLQCTCYNAPATSLRAPWKSSKVKVSRMLITASFIFTMSIKQLSLKVLLQPREQAKVIGSVWTVVRVRGSFDAHFYQVRFQAEIVNW